MLLTFSMHQPSGVCLDTDNYVHPTNKDAVRMAMRSSISLFDHSFLLTCISWSNSRDLFPTLQNVRYVVQNHERNGKCVYCSALERLANQIRIRAYTRCLLMSECVTGLITLWMGKQDWGFIDVAQKVSVKVAHRSTLVTLVSDTFSKGATRRTRPEILW